jgi:hypothetical protein
MILTCVSVTSFFPRTPQWHETAAGGGGGGGGWPWPPQEEEEGADEEEKGEWRRREAMWAAVKYGRSGLGDREEEEGEGEGQVDFEREAAASPGGQEREEEEDRVLAACARLDDGEAEWLAGEGVGRFVLLAYKAVAAAHLMGPANGWVEERGRERVE